MKKQIRDRLPHFSAKELSLALAFATLTVVSFSLLDTLSSSVAALPTQNEASYTIRIENSSSPSKNEAVISVFAPITETKYYTVREHDGMIGIFTGDEDTPGHVLPVYVFTLPEKTADELAVGIRCTEDELYRLLEAFTS